MSDRSEPPEARRGLGRPYLSVVIPAFNEADRIEPTLADVTAFFVKNEIDGETIVADDGSQDETARLVERYAAHHSHVRLLSLAHKGKGHAVKRGMLEARGEFRFLCDADLSMPIEMLAGFLPPAIDGLDILIGSREAPGARRFNEPGHRHFVGRAFNFIARTVSVPDVADTQCGFKLFRGEAAERLFALQTQDGFGFDVEILFLARKLGMRYAEHPIDWYFVTDSKVRPLRDGLRVFLDTLSVRLNDWRGRYEAGGPEA